MLLSEPDTNVRNREKWYIYLGLVLYWDLTPHPSIRHYAKASRVAFYTG